MIIAGAALLAGASLRPAMARDATAPAQGGEETAFAMPRVVAPGGGWGGVGLPQPLAPSDAALVRRIFAEQAAGNLQSAVADTDRLSDPMLLGEILADRYLGRFSRPDAASLAAWLSDYGNYPQAPAIHALLLQRLPPGESAPPAPRTEPLAAPPPSTPLPALSTRDWLSQTFPGLEKLARESVAAAAGGEAEAALRSIGRASGIGVLAGAQLRALVAEQLFLSGHDRQALQTARDALQRSHQAVGLAGYVGGLAAWRLGRADEARRMFDAGATAPSTAPDIAAGAGLWAARAALHDGDTAGYADWLRRAAAQPDTFYGRLARRALERATDAQAPANRDATLGNADIAAIEAFPAGRRAFALMQVGQPALAEATLRGLWPDAADDPGLGRAIMLVARGAGMIDLAAQVSALIERASLPAGPAPQPLPPLRPADGFLLDPALVYAVARQESNFDPGAVSAEGARGLMQLRPIAAGALADGPGDAARLASQLHEPGANLDLGQRYLIYLAGLSPVHGDLVRLLAAYNAGPATLARWNQTVRDGGDPLLFLATIPNDQTRVFVRRVLSYLWDYADRLHLGAPSLDALAADRWPAFAPERVLRPHAVAPAPASDATEIEAARIVLH